MFASPVTSGMLSTGSKVLHFECEQNKLSLHFVTVLNCTVYSTCICDLCFDKFKRAF
jgi:hypothetical protein